jgi:hypothetical protein
MCPDCSLCWSLAVVAVAVVTTEQVAAVVVFFSRVSIWPLVPTQ